MLAQISRTTRGGRSPRLGATVFALAQRVGWCGGVLALDRSSDRPIVDRSPDARDVRIAWAGLVGAREEHDIRLAGPNPLCPWDKWSTRHRGRRVGRPSQNVRLARSASHSAATETPA